MIVPNWSGTIPVVNGGADSGDTLSKAVSGGTAAFGWSAPQGLENGKTLIVSSDTLTFEAPDKYVYLGFGQGWLYENPEGTPLDDLIIGSETLTYEYGAGAGNNRKIKTINGQKFLNSFIYDNADPSVLAGGMINWDTGANLTPSDTCIQFSRSRCSIGINPDASVQWKQDRVGQDMDLGDTNNSMYFKSGGAPASSNATSVQGINGDGGSTVYYGKAPNHNGAMSTFIQTWKQNTPDLQDGLISTRCSTETAPSFNRIEPSASGDRYTTGIITTDSLNRPRFLKRQDYIGNNDNGARDINIDVTDLYWAVNGDVFVIADNADLSLVTQQPIVCIPQSYSGDSKSVNLLLWSGAMSNFSGKYLHRLDSGLNVLNTVAL